MIRRPPRSTQSRSSAASDVYKRQAGDAYVNAYGLEGNERLTQWHIGMYYLPIKNVELGTELMGGRRTTFGGDTGSLSRLNLQARYIFN